MLFVRRRISGEFVRVEMFSPLLLTRVFATRGGMCGLIRRGGHLAVVVCNEWCLAIRGFVRRRTRQSLLWRRRLRLELVF